MSQPTPQEWAAFGEDTLDALSDAHSQLEAHKQFVREVGALMLRLLNEGDATALVLLELVRDLNARTGEIYVEEN